MVDNPVSLAIRARDISVLLGLCLAIFFWKLGDIPFYERGEPREGLVVAEMNSSGNWILPRVNGEYIPFKPPLFHWMEVLLAIATMPAHIIHAKSRHTTTSRKVDVLFTPRMKASTDSI